MVTDNQNTGLDVGALQSTYDSLRPDQRERVEDKVLDICYDRMACTSLGVDYNTLPGDDMLKVYRHAMQRLGYLTSE